MPEGEIVNQALLLCAGIVAVIIFASAVYRIFCRRKAEKRVRERTDEEKLRDFKAVLNQAGFDYALSEDFVFSQKNPWQKKVGYSRFYDEAAGAMNMIIDCEPITFFYDNHYWLIEFWKGQYGMATGGEIGIYKARADRRTAPDFYDGTLFVCVGERDYMDMEFTLYREGEKLLERKENHWWLTAFKPGVFSQPDMLHMECSVKFPNQLMQQAFLKGMKRCGYEEREININKNSVTFFYTEPRSRQPVIRAGLGKRIQRQNKRNCKLYLRLTKKYERTLDKADYIRYRLPRLYRKLTAVGRLRMQVGIR